MESKQVEEIPLNGRNPINLAALDPAVVPQGGTTGAPRRRASTASGTIKLGGTANQSATPLDGAPINISYVNSTALIPVQDSIQEFRVATNDISPEFGRYAGGVLNMSTKSGTNQLHGVSFQNQSGATNNFISVYNRVLDSNEWNASHRSQANGV